MVRAGATAVQRSVGRRDTGLLFLGEEAALSATLRVDTAAQRKRGGALQAGARRASREARRKDAKAVKAYWGVNFVSFGKTFSVVPSSSA